MKKLNKPLRLNPEMVQALDEIRHARRACLLHGLAADKAEAEVRRIALTMVEDANLSRIATMQYWWFLREITRLFRTRTGADLAWHIEAVMRKWLEYGLEQNTMQLLVGEVILKTRQETEDDEA